MSGLERRAHNHETAACRCRHRVWQTRSEKQVVTLILVDSAWRKRHHARLESVRGLKKFAAADNRRAVL